MTNEDAPKPDPMADICEADVDALLAETGELIEKAAEEVGDLGDDAPAEQSTGQPDSKPMDDISPDIGDAAEPDSPSQEPAADKDVDSQLAELEALLDKTAAGANAPAAESAEPSKPDPPPETDAAKVADTEGIVAPTPSDETPPEEAHVDAAPAPEPPTAEAPAEKPPSEAIKDAADSEEVDDFDNFDISVDLGDDEEAADKEIAEELAAGGRQAGGAGVGSAEPHSLVDYVLSGVVTLVGGVFIVLDRPFAKISTETKRVFGWVAIVTLLFAMGGFIYGALAY
jgi:hypothetical protein